MKTKLAVEDAATTNTLVSVEVTTSPIATSEEVDAETKAVEDALKKNETDGSEKQTLVDDLNAEIDEGEEDENNFNHLKEQTETAGSRSRNAQDEKTTD